MKLANATALSVRTSGDVALDPDHLISLHYASVDVTLFISWMFFASSLQGEVAASFESCTQCSSFHLVRLEES